MKKYLILYSALCATFFSLGSAHADWAWDSATKTLTDGNWVLNATLAGSDLSITGKKSVTDPTTLDLRQTIIGGYSIVSIGGFANTEGLVNLYLPDSLLTFTMSAFRQCMQLTTVYPLLPPNLVTFADRVFCECTNLVGDVVFPASTTTMTSGWQNTGGKNGCFQNTKITTCDMSAASFKNIPESSFALCKNLKWAKLPQGLIELGGLAFRDCGALESVTPLFESTVTNIGFSAFYLCTNLVGDVVINSSAPAVIMPKNNNNGGWGTFSRTRITSATITAHVDTISSSMFNGCKELVTVVLPERVSRINGDAFGGCTSLRSITPFLPNTITNLGQAVFYNCPNLVGDLVIGGTNLVTYQHHNNNGFGVFENTGITTATITAPTVQFCGRLFSNCKALTKVTLPKRLDKFNWGSDLGNGALLTEVYFLGNVPENFKNGFSAVPDYKVRVYAPRGEADWEAFQEENVTPMDETLEAKYRSLYPEGPLPKGIVTIVNNGTRRLWYMLWTTPDSQLRTTILMVR